MNVNELLPKIIEKLTKIWQRLRRYQTVIFIVFVALLYGFLVFRINSLSGQQPSDSDISAQLQRSSTPHIDQSSVDKIKQLQDNSVQVKTLFNNARNNPFAE